MEKIFQIPKHDEDPSTEIINWLNDHDGWDGDECGITLHESDEVCEPGDWITSIPDSSRMTGKRLVRLPRKGRRMNNCQMDDDNEMELWSWALPDGRAIFLYDGTDPRMAFLAVESPERRGTWFPVKEK